MKSKKINEYVIPITEIINKLNLKSGLCLGLELNLDAGSESIDDEGITVPSCYGNSKLKILLMGE